MSIGRLNFDEVSEQDLKNLIVTGVPEGMAIEYKRDIYGRADADVREFLKDVTAFANSVGGDIVIGMEEEGGIPISLKSISSTDRDTEIQRLDSLLRDGIEPRIPGVRIRAIDISSGGFVLVIRVPKSWRPPHRVSARNTNRFFVRNSSGVHEASVDELRVLFNFSAAAIERARAIRGERVAKILANSGSVDLSNERGKLIVHIVPLSAFSGVASVDLRQAHSLREYLPLISGTGMRPQFNFDGFINIWVGTSCSGYTQLFRNGVIEATRCGILRHDRGRWLLPARHFEKYLLSAIRTYLEAAKLLSIDPPLIVMLTVDGMHGAELGIAEHESSYDPQVPINRSLLELPEIVIDGYGTANDYDQAIRPAIDALWNASGYPGSN